MGNELVRYDERFAADAAQYAESEDLGGGSFISTKGGVLQFGEEELPGNQMCVIVLDAVFENTFYGARYDPENSLPPRCYAFGRKVDELGPHPSMQDGMHYFEPQAYECSACPWAEWGSADTGKGKACQNRRRLAVIPAGFFERRGRKSKDYDLELFDDPRDFAESDIAYIKLPVTSTKNWAKYVNHLNSTCRRPPYGVITRVFLEPDPKSQYRVEFEMIEEVPEDLYDIIWARHEEAMKAIIQPYRAPDKDELEERRGGGKRLGGLRQRSGRR